MKDLYARTRGMKDDTMRVTVHGVDSPLLGAALWAIIFTLLMSYVLTAIQIFGNPAPQVNLVRKFDACFVVYKDDIEPIPCPPTEAVKP